jgi:hypothetical protein
MEKNKYLVVSIPSTHDDLLEQIKKNAQDNKLTVSHYVRNLLYEVLQQKAATRVDVRRATRAVAKSV